MDAQRFADWLQGYVELDGRVPNQAQWDSIKEHLGLVFNKVTSQVHKGITETKITAPPSITFPQPFRFGDGIPGAIC